jgi:hypothetical protein
MSGSTRELTYICRTRVARKIHYTFTSYTTALTRIAFRISAAGPYSAVAGQFISAASKALRCRASRAAFYHFYRGSINSVPYATASRPFTVNIPTAKELCITRRASTLESGRKICRRTRSFYRRVLSSHATTSCIIAIGIPQTQPSFCLASRNIILHASPHTVLAHRPNRRTREGRIRRTARYAGYYIRALTSLTNRSILHASTSSYQTLSVKRTDKSSATVAGTKPRTAHKRGRSRASRLGEFIKSFASKTTALARIAFRITAALPYLAVASLLVSTAVKALRRRTIRLLYNLNTRTVSSAVAPFSTLSTLSIASISYATAARPAIVASNTQKLTRSARIRRRRTVANKARRSTGYRTLAVRAFNYHRFVAASYATALRIFVFLILQAEPGFTSASIPSAAIRFSSSSPPKSKRIIILRTKVRRDYVGTIAAESIPTINSIATRRTLQTRYPRAHRMASIARHSARRRTRQVIRTSSIRSANRRKEHSVHIQVARANREHRYRCFNQLRNLYRHNRLDYGFYRSYNQRLNYQANFRYRRNIRKFGFYSVNPSGDFIYKRLELSNRYQVRRIYRRLTATAASSRRSYYRHHRTARSARSARHHRRRPSKVPSYSAWHRRRADNRRGYRRPRWVRVCATRIG